MSAPLPLQGTTNPFSLGYQKRQSGLGNLGVQDQTTDTFEALASLTAAQTAAQAVTPLTERAKQKANPQPGIVRTF